MHNLNVHVLINQFSGYFLLHLFREEKIGQILPIEKDRRKRGYTYS